MMLKFQNIPFLFILTACLLVPSIGHGADISVTLTLDRLESTTADSVRMKVSISGARESASPPMIHGLDAFQVTQGGTSSRVEIINGKMNAGVDYTYFLQPKQPGTFQIGPAEVTIKGKTFQSNIDTLTVTKTSTATGENQGPIFLVSSLSSNDVYLEEQTIYTLKLYIRTNVRDISLHPLNADGIAFTQLGSAQEYQSVHNGQTYRVIEVRYALVPSRPGEFVIGPAKMNMTVLESRGRSPRSLFDDPFFNLSTGRPITVTGDPLPLNVRPLPERNRPADFIGLVGRFKITSSLEPSTIKAGESVTLTIQIKGTGKIKLIPDLEIPPLTDTKIYADQPVLTATQDRDGLGGSKTMKWALVPEKEGSITIPSISLTYFDVNTHQYRTLTTPPHSLTVLPGQGQSNMNISGTLKDEGTNESTKKTIKELGRDILPIHTSVKALSQPLFPERNDPAIGLVVLVPVFIYGVIFFMVLFKKKSIESQAMLTAKRAAKEFIKQYNQKDICANDLLSVIRDYLNQRLGLSLGALTTDEASEILKSNGVSHEAIQDMCSILQKCEDAVYTGRGRTTLVQDVDMAKLIKRIDKEIR